MINSQLNKKLDVINSLAKNTDYHLAEIQIQTQGYNNQQDALQNFFSEDGAGWVCETGTSKIHVFDNIATIIEKITGEVLEGEIAFHDQSCSAQITRSSDGGWQIVKVTELIDGNPNHLCKDVLLRKRQGGTLAYRIGLSEIEGRLTPSCQRFMGINKREQEDNS